MFGAYASIIRILVSFNFKSIDNRFPSLFVSMLGTVYSKVGLISIATPLELVLEPFIYITIF